MYTFDRKDEKIKSVKKSNSKYNLGEIKNKKIENSLKEFAKVYREKNDQENFCTNNFCSISNKY